MLKQRRVLTGIQYNQLCELTVVCSEFLGMNFITPVDITCINVRSDLVDLVPWCFVSTTFASGIGSSKPCTTRMGFVEPNRETRVFVGFGNVGATV